MPKEHGLAALHVGVTRQDVGLFLVDEFQPGQSRVAQGLFEPQDLLAHEQAAVQGHLVVAAAPLRCSFPRHGPQDLLQAAFDVAVDIL